MPIAVQDIQDRVRERYGAIAERHLAEIPVTSSCCGGTSCCSETISDVSAALTLYTPDQIRDLPPEIVGATLGCGNPTALAALQPGETVLDLGSGAGLDCFLAARQVGPTGHVIGLDMTETMLELARRNQVKVGLPNVEFRYGHIEQMPLPDASVDVIISNCVINLSADKDAVFREAYRVLKPGGRFAVSDVVTRGDVPTEFRKALDLWAGCLSGALDEQDYIARLQNVGFIGVLSIGREALSGKEIEDWAEETAQTRRAGCCTSDLTRDLAEKIYSAKIWAYKPTT
ncbi:MAG TPA: arsenite methyltransferase [Anaerolineae bacterium]|nr:arsenite methyltransferase [Anaerolineae bacterium]